jgi:hypothetical protein
MTGGRRLMMRRMTMIQGLVLMMQLQRKEFVGMRGSLVRQMTGSLLL